MSGDVTLADLLGVDPKELGPASKDPPRHALTRGTAPNGCKLPQHRAVVDAKNRRVYCKACGADLDPFAVLGDIAAHHEWHDRLTEDMRRLSAEVEALTAAREKLRAAVRRARAAVKPMTPASILDAGARVAPGTVRAALRAVPVVPRALLTPPRPGAVVVRRPPPYVVACFLARAVQGDDCAAIHEAAGQLLALVTTDAADPMLETAMRTAIRLRDRAAALPEADRAPVVVAMLRDLLDDAPTRAAVEMDVALVRAARECGTTPDARHRELAAGIAAEVMR